MIFRPNRSRRRELFFEKFSNERASEQTNQTIETNKEISKKKQKIIKSIFIMSYIFYYEMKNTPPDALACGNALRFVPFVHSFVRSRPFIKGEANKR